MVSGKCDNESGSGSSSILVGASKQPAVSFKAYGRSFSEDDNASGFVGYDPLVGSRDLVLGVNSGSKCLFYKEVKAVVSSPYIFFKIKMVELCQL